jgi:hypothetical protein
MKRKSTILILFIILIGFFLIAFDNLNDQQNLTLEIREDSSNKLLESIPVKSKEIVRIKFFHSYDKGYVWEDFIIKDKKFLLNEVAYAVPSYDMRDATYEKAPRRLGEDGVVYIENIDEYYEEEEEQFLIRVPYTVPQWIITENEKVELADLASSGTLLKVKITE